MAAVPVELAFRVEHHDGKGKAGGTVFWLFGIARVRLGKGKSGDHTVRKRVKARRRRRKPGTAGRLVAVFERQGFLSRLLRLALDVLRRIQILELSLRIRMGLDDPADTGRLWAVLGPLSGMLAMLPVAHIAVEPRFDSAEFDIDLRSRIRVIPLRLLFTVLVFALSPATLRAVRAAA